MLKDQNLDSKGGGSRGRVDEVYFPAMNHKDDVDGALEGRSACHTTLPSACSKYLSHHGIGRLCELPVLDDQITLGSSSRPC